jgi:8-oxo-dGTP pyrophosphatase MutT (NUDIX family)
MPPGLAGLLNDGPPVEPRPSASVLLVRGRQPWEVLLMQRPREVDFAAGAHVFPGGSVHGEDREAADPLRAAAIRELFEEVGVLVARGPSGPVGHREIVQLRERLQSRPGGWAAALGELRLAPALDRLTTLTRWITPAALRRRFDTTFFIARLPRDQEIEPSRDEVAAWTWIEPARALEDGSIVLVYATRHILESVAGEPDISRLIARLRRRRLVHAVEPRVVQTEEGWTIVH